MLTNTGELAFAAPAVDPCGSSAVGRFKRMNKSNDRPTACSKGMVRRLRLRVGQIYVDGGDNFNETV